MTDTSADPRFRRTYRWINFVFWLALWGATVWWTRTWGVWWVMGLEASVPLALGGYIHLILRPGGTAAG